jgi:protein-S-isoprenylcysteine O-methyltransferase Ste14
LYAYVRHPATAFKVGFFIVSFAKSQSGFDLVGFIAILFWISIYIARAIFEERFLIKTKDYQEYSKKTRYRFIPGLF